jgi:hypothetical protein
LRVRIRIHTRSLKSKEQRGTEVFLLYVLALAGLIAALILAETGHDDLARILLGVEALHGAARWRIDISWRS